MKLYENDPAVESTYKEQSRIVGEMTRAVSLCIIEGNYRPSVQDLSHRVCEYHFANPERKGLIIRTELVRSPLYASVELKGDDKDVEEIKELIATRDIPNVQLD